MGLFDSFITKGQECPNCGHSLRELQTKSFAEPSVFQIYPGVAIPMRSRGLSKIEVGEVPCYTSCDKCKYWLDYRAQIRKNRTGEVDLVSSRPGTMSAAG